MSQIAMTSTGHGQSDAPWLDAHFQSALPEYEDALRFVGIQAGWTVLDAGCGSGGYVPMICEQTGPTGRVSALDLAPENVAQVEGLMRGGHCQAPVEARVGSLLDLPYAEASFDGLWCANVVQYLTKAEFARAMAEFRRVTKPGGVVAVKDSDRTLLQVLPIDPAVHARVTWAWRQKAAKTGLLGPWCGSTLASFFREIGLMEIERRSWLIERWAPPSPATRAFLTMAFRHGAQQAEEHGLSMEDRNVLMTAATNPDRVLDDPDFCFREGFVVTKGRVPA